TGPSVIIDVGAITLAEVLAPAVDLPPSFDGAKNVGGATDATDSNDSVDTVSEKSNEKFSDGTFLSSFVFAATSPGDSAPNVTQGTKDEVGELGGSG
ncbi:hypothetical protein HK102_012717, partial [Quaeritorhiza haematococci]